MTDVRIVKFEPCELIICDELLLADFMLRRYCDFLCDSSLNDQEPLVKPDTIADLGDNDGDICQPKSNQSTKDLGSKLSMFDLNLTKQLVLVRNCLADVLYAINCLGSWCTKRIIKLYITEFSRLLNSKNDEDQQPSVDIIGSTLTTLQGLYMRLEELTVRLTLKYNNNFDDVLKHGSSLQLRTLLHYIKDHQQPPTATWPICIVHVHRKIPAKVIALWLRELSEEFEQYSFIKPNYIVGSSRKHRNKMAVDNFDLHHEASIRDFRFGKCNCLVISSMNERCADMLRCNLVISYDFPTNFADYLQAKLNCRNDNSKYVIMANDFLVRDFEDRLLKYFNMEKILNGSNKKDILEPYELDILRSLEKEFPPYPSISPVRGIKSCPATVLRSINIINKYCAKLPSDSFTKLSPEWSIEEFNVSNETNDGCKKYFCRVRLPINSPVRQTIVGPPAVSKGIATRLAAFTACKVLHEAGELDDNMQPIKKDSMKVITPWLKDFIHRPKLAGSNKSQPLGSTKHRQYYKKRIASVFSGPKITDEMKCFLYKFKMILTCPIPDEQNRRGRRIIDPSETDRNYAIICNNKLPQICSFPVFTRSGEVMISLECVAADMQLTDDQVKSLRKFHEYTFSKVLRLEKYPTMYDPDNSPFTILLAPVRDEKILPWLQPKTGVDWDFVQKIVNSDHSPLVPEVEERKNFKFNHDDYIDAVVIPWYRLTDRQQFSYYVAEICTNMNPCSAFPDQNSGFKTFADYYESKYNLAIFNKEQPVLDVDHTSARLNLLTPRYVNRKGKTLPSSTAKTRRESRESLDRKQLLIPELCSIHPFPASFWRKAVCLPAIFYRLNSLFLAEELRREVAGAIKVGFVEPPLGFEWPNLDFGWSLRDVICSQSVENSIDNKRSTPDKSSIAHRAEKKKTTKKSMENPAKSQIDSILQDARATEASDFVIDYFDPSKLDIPDIPLDSPPDEWMNIKLISTNASKSNLKTGWDQELEHQDLLLRHTNEITWDDCEMNFDGELSEKLPEMRCGSPSNFESNTNPDDTATCNSKGRFDSSGSIITFTSPYVNYADDDLTSDEDTVLVNKKFGEGFNMFNEDSDSSWSISDDDYIEEEETLALPGDWSDEKAKKQARVRELFVPYSKIYPNASIHKQIEELYEQLRNVEQSQRLQFCLAKGLETSLSSAALEFVDRIEPIVAKEPEDNVLYTILSEVFGDIKLDDICKRNAAYKSWILQYDLLNSEVDRALKKTPDLFKDNDIELIPVDEPPTDLNLNVQPAFGQLLPNRDTSGDLLPNEEWKSIRFDPVRCEIKSDGPGPSVILQALTMSNASDGINLERLETVGDSFLKYSITAYLYCMYPKLHEGKLSYLRSTEISNANLYQLGKAKNLGEIMSATKFEPNDNWLPPGYTVADTSVATPDEEQANHDVKRRHKKREIDKALAEVPYDLLRQHSIPDKSIADCVEALIGAYLTASGSRAALLFMQWLGLRVVPPTYSLEDDLASESPETAMWRWLEIPPSPLIYATPTHDPKFPRNAIVETGADALSDLKASALEELNKLYEASNMISFEEEIQYSFKDKAYLVQAFTHNSYHVNHVTDCHQRLEFLGDALLDYLITRYLFEDPRCHSPGTLTDLRSALVNNTFFASLAVKYNFHKYLMFISEDLSHAIEELVKKFRFNSKDTITKGYTLLIGEGESEYAEDIEVPKALGDVFESVAGAIYLDSGMSLDQVWQVYFQMMKPEIEYFSRNVPKSPIRELLESKPQNVRFSPSELAPDKKHRVTAEVFGLGRFTGVGRSKHSAKSTAAKRALRMLEVRRHRELEKSKNDEDGGDENEDDDDDDNLDSGSSD